MYIMKKLTKLFALALALSVSLNVNAAGSTGISKISGVGFNTGGFYLYGDNWANPNNCTETGVMVLKDTDSNYDKAYSLLLAAYTSGKEVYGLSDGCITHDGKTYNTIRGFKYLVVR
jgi:hypothetical protein